MLHLQTHNTLSGCIQRKVPQNLAMTNARSIDKESGCKSTCPCTELAMDCMQLGVDGGPETGFTIQFDSTNSDFVKIDPTSGLLEAKAPGQTVSSDLYSENTSWFPVYLLLILVGCVCVVIHVF